MKLYGGVDSLFNLKFLRKSGIVIGKTYKGSDYMKPKPNFRLENITAAIFSVTALLFVVFAVCTVAFKDNTVYTARDIASYKTVEGYTEKEIADSSAPVGVRKEYSWQIGAIDNNESCLMFYVVHSYAEVRLDLSLIHI